MALLFITLSSSCGYKFFSCVLQQFTRGSRRSSAEKQHDEFVASRLKIFLGRQPIIDEIHSHIFDSTLNAPFLLVGSAGSGKSSVISALVDQVKKRIYKMKTRPKLFYHFVGAVHGSTDVFCMLKRLLLETGACKPEATPTSLEAAVQMTCCCFSNPNISPTVIIVDALNQLDDESLAHLVSWLPSSLPTQLRVVFSCIDGTAAHVNLVSRIQNIHVQHLPPLSKQSRLAIANSLFSLHKKTPTARDVRALLEKTASANPLWLSIAIEEVLTHSNGDDDAIASGNHGNNHEASSRNHGNDNNDKQLPEDIADGAVENKKIGILPNDLLGLEVEVLNRLQGELRGSMLKNALCLLEISFNGLNESELLQIFEDPSLLEDCPVCGASDVTRTIKDQWSEVKAALKPYLRPYGDKSEGRIDFYHRSFSKAVCRKYFTNDDDTPNQLVKTEYHRILAKYFQKQKHNLVRVIEEYPSHLIQINDMDNLERFLMKWDVFDELFDEEFSYSLIKFWRLGFDLNKMKDCYLVALNNYTNSANTTMDQLSRRLEKLAQLLVQAGFYEQANELAKRSMRIEVDTLNSRPQRLAELYFLVAFVKDEELKLHDFMYRSQLPCMRTIIEDYQSAVKYCKTQNNTAIKTKHARALNRLSFYYSGYSLRGGDEYLSAETAKSKALEVIEEAILMFKELEDEVHVADSLVTKGVAFGNADPCQLQAYMEGYELAMRVVGNNHAIMDRLHLNVAIHYEENHDYDKAYHHFRAWYSTCLSLYGKSHPKTQRPLNTLNEEVYLEMARKNGDEVPS